MKLLRQDNCRPGISVELSSAVYEWPVCHKCCYLPQLARVLYYYYYYYYYFNLLVAIRWRFPGKFRSQQEIEAIYPNTL